MDFEQRFKEEASALLWSSAISEEDDPRIASSQGLAPSLWVHHWNTDPFVNTGPDWSIAYIQPVIPEGNNEDSPLPEGFSILTKMRTLLGLEHPVAKPGGWRRLTSGTDTERITEMGYIKTLDTVNEWSGLEELPVSSDCVEIEKVYLVYRGEDIYRAEIPPTETWGSLLEFIGSPIHPELQTTFDKIASLAWVSLMAPILDMSLTEEIKKWAVDETARLFSSCWIDTNSRLRGRNIEENDESWILPPEIVMNEIRRFIPEGALLEYYGNITKVAPDEEKEMLAKFFNITSKPEEKAEDNLNASYWIYLDGEQDGPFSLHEARSIVMDRNLTSVTKVWREDQPKWSTLKDHPELAEIPVKKDNAPPVPEGNLPEIKDRRKKPRADQFWVNDGISSKQLSFSEIGRQIRLNKNFLNFVAWDESQNAWRKIHVMFLSECINASVDMKSKKAKTPIDIPDRFASDPIIILSDVDKKGPNPIDLIKWERDQQNP